MIIISSVNIGKNLIGNGHPTFIIAEAGLNHNGDIDLAKKMIKSAKKCGVDAIKFQTFTAEKIVDKRESSFEVYD